MFPHWLKRISSTVEEGLLWYQSCRNLQREVTIIVECPGNSQNSQNRRNILQCDPPLYYLPSYQSGFFLILILNLTPPLSSPSKLFSNNVPVTDTTLYCLIGKKRSFPRPPPNQPPTMRMRREFAVFVVLPVLRSEIRMVNLGEREEHADMIQPTNLLHNFPQTSLAIFFFSLVLFLVQCYWTWKRNSQREWQKLLNGLSFFLFIYLFASFKICDPICYRSCCSLKWYKQLQKVPGWSK